ncbi:MAG TPA: biotin/lipoyl-containing protein, partial [Albitalea sp.]|nr:biotin/lipoyl-containing protein [Albitalea sp.]
MALVEVKVPDIGDFKEVEVIELLVKPGDTVTKEQSLITVESDKASMEIPSTHAGVVKELRVKLGDKVAEGSLLLMMEGEGGAVAASVPPPPSADAPKAAAPPPPSPQPSPESAKGIEGGGTVEVVVPDIGDFDEVAVIEVFIKPGDAVKAEQSLITVESDKASMEIPSSHAGVVKEVKVKVGDKVKKGSPLAIVEATGGAAPAAAPAASAAAPAPTAAKADTAAPASERVAPTAALPMHEPASAGNGKLPHASPSVRRLARELGVPLEEVKGSGPNGRITQDDVHAFVKGVMAGTAQTRAQGAKAPPAA